MLKCFDLYLSPPIRFLVYQIVDGERLPFGDYEIGEWDLSLCTRYPEPYPDPSVSVITGFLSLSMIVFKGVLL